MELRLIKEADAEATVELLTQVFTEAIYDLATQEVHRMFSKETYVPHFLGAFESDILVGVCAVVQIIFTTDTFGLCWLAVHPNLQHQGIGKLLITEAIRYTENDLLFGKLGSMLLSCLPELVPYYTNHSFHTGAPMHTNSIALSRILNANSKQ